MNTEDPIVIAVRWFILLLAFSVLIYLVIYTNTPIECVQVCK